MPVTVSASAVTLIFIGLHSAMELEFLFHLAVETRTTDQHSRPPEKLFAHRIACLLITPAESPCGWLWQRGGIRRAPCVIASALRLSGDTRARRFGPAATYSAVTHPFRRIRCKAGYNDPSSPGVRRLNFAGSTWQCRIHTSGQ